MDVCIHIDGERLTNVLQLIILHLQYGKLFTHLKHVKPEKDLIISRKL